MLDRKIYKQLKQIENNKYGLSIRKNENGTYSYVVYEKGKGLNYSIIDLPVSKINNIGNLVHGFEESVKNMSDSLFENVYILDLDQLLTSIKVIGEKYKKGKNINSSFSNIYKSIVEQASMIEIFEYYGLNIIKKGKNIKTICPFHNDHDPSLHILPNDKGWICFVCNEKGNAIQFVQKYEQKIRNTDKFTTIDAMNKIIEICHLNIQKLSNNDKHNMSTHNNIKYSDSQIKMIEILNKLTDIASYQLFNENNKGYQYLKNRGFTEDLLKKLKFGWIPNDLINQWINSEKPPFELSVLETIGFIRKNNSGVYTPTYNNRILIPVLDEKGNTVTFSGRTIENHIKPKYLLGISNEIFRKDNHLYNYNYAKKYAYGDSVLVVEGFMDVAAALRLNFNNVVATMGTSLSEEQLSMIKRLNAKIILCRDNDDPGIQSMLKEIPRLLKLGFDVKVMDLSEVARKINTQKDKKDLWDLASLGVDHNELNNNVVSGLEFILKHELFRDKIFKPDLIYSAYVNLINRNLIKNKIDEENFVYFVKHEAKEQNIDGKEFEIYSSEDIRKIIFDSPIEKQPVLKPLYNSLLGSYLEKGIQENLNLILEFSGVKLSEEILIQIENEIKNSFYNNPELYLKDNMTSIDFHSLIQSNSKIIQKHFDDKEKLNSLSLAMTLYSYHNSSLNNSENLKIYDYLKNQKYIHPKLIEHFISTKQLIQYTDSKKAIHYAFLHRNKKGYLNNISDYKINEETYIQKWGLDNYAFNIRCKNNLCKQVLCFPDMLELLCYQTLMIKKNIPLSNYEYLSVERNEISESINEYCNTHKNKKICFLFNKGDESIKIDKIINDLSKKFPKIEFENHSKKLLVGTNYEEMLKSIIEKPSEIIVSR